VLAEDLIAMASEEAVSPVAERAGNNAKQEGSEPPNAAELGEYGDGGVGLDEKLFRGLAGIEEDADSIELGEIDAMRTK